MLGGRKMCQSCTIHIDGVWQHINPYQPFRTPDNLHNAAYEISVKGDDKIHISPQNINIKREAFIKTLHYLRKNHNYSSNPCEIRSNNNPDLAGPLCIASRAANNNVRCINYILPILKSLNIVGLEGSRPNTTWLVC